MNPTLWASVTAHLIYCWNYRQRENILHGENYKRQIGIITHAPDIIIKKKSRAEVTDFYNCHFATFAPKPVLLYNQRLYETHSQTLRAAQDTSALPASNTSKFNSFMTFQIFCVIDLNICASVTAHQIHFSNYLICENILHAQGYGENKGIITQASEITMTK